MFPVLCEKPWMFSVHQGMPVQPAGLYEDQKALFQFIIKLGRLSDTVPHWPGQLIKHNDIAIGYQRTNLV
jgi:hypothetical protein